MQCIPTMAYYAIKMKKLLMYATKWMNLRNIMPVDTKCNLFICRKFPENTNLQKQEADCSCLSPGLGAGTDPQEDTRGDGFVLKFHDGYDCITVYI